MKSVQRIQLMLRMWPMPGSVRARERTLLQQAALNASGENPLSDEVIQFNRPFMEALFARMTNDSDKARTAFHRGASKAGEVVQVLNKLRPPAVRAWLIDAALGRKQDALLESRRAVELLPVEKDAINGVRMICYWRWSQLGLATRI